jgi:hypothetical protein
VVEIQQPTRYWEAAGWRRVDPQPKPTTEYTIRPRSNTDAGRRPLSVIVPPPTNRQSPIVESDYERTRSPLSNSYYASEDADPYIYPASSSRGRYHYRAADESDHGRLAPSDKESRARTDRGKYRNSGSGASKAYPASGSVVKYRERDFADIDAYSYTNPEEQFDRDSVAGQQSRRENHNSGERPRSMTGLEGYRPQLELRREPRDFVPPPPRRTDRLRPDDGYRSSNRSSWSSQRAPVSLHKSGDDGYSSYQEDYGHYRDSRYPRRYEDSNPRGSRPQPSRNHDDKHYSSDTGRRNTGGDGPRAEPTTIYPRDSHRRDYDYGGTSRSDHRTTREHDAEYARDRADGKSGSRDPKAADEAAKAHSRRKEASRRDHSDSDADDYTTDEGRQKHLRPPGERQDPESPSNRDKPQDESRRNRQRDSEADDSDSHGRTRRNRNKDTDEDTASDSRQSAVEDRLRRTQISKRTASREPETPPKGILKPPREKFPEDKNAVREGVALFKMGNKKGIPPGARWTKIDRRMVNPAALEAKQERFEERLDYVIVLRVLTREEIQEFAEETQKIRGMFSPSKLCLFMVHSNID